MAVPYTFAAQTGSIPLSQLDSNFSTAITLGNTAVVLGNTYSTLGNLTLSNVTISSGNVAINVANVSTINTVTLTVTGNETVGGNVTITGNVTANVYTANILTSPASTNLTLQSAGTTAVTVDTSQNVGIGTSSPATKLQVAGEIRNSSDLSNSGDPTVYSYNGASAGTVQSGIQFVGSGQNIRAYTAGTERMRIDSSGNLGLGVTPSGNFTFQTQNNYSSGFKGFAIGGIRGGASGGGYPWLGYNLRPTSTSDTYNYDFGDVASAIKFAGGINFYVAPSGTAGNTISFTQAMTLDNSGNLGIGTTSPSVKLDVGGYGQFTASNSQISFIDSSNSNYKWSIQGTSSAVRFYDNTAGTERMRIDSSGNVGIGTTSPSASAILDAQSTTKGVRMPNMTTTQKNAIASPAAGLMVFDTTLSKLCVYTGSAWQTITSI